MNRKKKKKKEKRPSIKNIPTVGNESEKEDRFCAKPYTNGNNPSVYVQLYFHEILEPKILQRWSHFVINDGTKRRPTIFIFGESFSGLKGNNGGSLQLHRRNCTCRWTYHIYGDGSTPRETNYHKLRAFFTLCYNYIPSLLWRFVSPMRWIVYTNVVRSP